MSGPPNVERIIAVVVAALDGSSRDVTWGGEILGSDGSAAISLQILPLEASTQARSQLRGATRIWGENISMPDVCLVFSIQYLHRTPPCSAPPRRTRCSSSCGPG